MVQLEKKQVKIISILIALVFGNILDKFIL